MLITANPASRTAPSRTATAEAPENPPPHATFSPERVVGLFYPWRHAKKILLAVSGGPDSVALMLLAADWARMLPDPPHLRVATVDHGLRQEGAREAETVGRWARRLGLAHDILVWRGEKPKSRVQERARDARYDLLFALAARVDADVVATAHHADDQAETILFRLLRGSGLGGLSGMAASLERQGAVHARPLLQCNKTELIAFCQANAHGFFTDPSNFNPAYARTRIRAVGGLLEQAGLGRDALLRFGRRAARAEAALTARAETVAAGLIAAREPGLFSADISRLAEEPEEILLRVLASEILLVGACKRPLRLERLETLASAVRKALAADERFAATLGGTELKLNRKRVLMIRTEKQRRTRDAAYNSRLPDP